MVLAAPSRAGSLPLPPGVTVRAVPPEDAELDRVWAVPAVAFGHPGTAAGKAGVQERDKIAADYDGGTIEMLRERLRSGHSVVAAAFGPDGPLAAGSYQAVDGVAEITGVGVLPSSRRQGLGAAVTALLARDALDRGVATVFLSASDDAVARVYARIGFREVGVAGGHGVPAAGGERQRHASLPRQQDLPEGLGVGHRFPVGRPRSQPEGGNERARGQCPDLVERGVPLAQFAVTAERADQGTRRRQPVAERREVAAEHPGRAIAAREAQGHVGGAEPAFRVARHAPAGPRRPYPQRPGELPRQVHCQVGQVLRAARLVEALQ
jgi:ribosomal protein S18 acetylase RimI-like enzyme